MIRPLCVALLAVAVAAAAPVPKTTAKDYQKLADQTEWTFADRKSVADQLADESKGYQAKVIAEEGRSVTVRITDDKQTELWKSETHPLAVIVQRNGVLYSTDFHPSSSGCAVVAFDLTAKKQLW